MKTIRKSPDLAELAPAQLGHLQEKSPPASVSRGWNPILGLKGRQAKDDRAVSVSGDTPIAPTPREQPENQFRLQVDRQTKASYTTYEAAEAAGLAVKQNHPIVQVAVYDAKAGVNKVIELPKN
ncbi:MAG: hypothetical protein ACLPKB_17780 [Xanthobacteraceae bacterium]